MRERERKGRRIVMGVEKMKIISTRATMSNLPVPEVQVYESNNKDGEEEEVVGYAGGGKRKSLSNVEAEDGMSTESSTPCAMSPYNADSPFAKSPWHNQSCSTIPNSNSECRGGGANVLLGSLTREEGHIYSLAATGPLLYTGSDSKNIRVWKNQKEFAAFKSGSGLVKAIVISGQKIFTGHQDGKIRIWKTSAKNPAAHKRLGSLPRLKDFVRSSINPNNYVEVRRNRSFIWIRHFDVVSSLSIDEDEGLLYSGSWDRTLKVWRISDSKCLESVAAHDDAINSVVVGFNGLVFTGSADGTVRAWRREWEGGKLTRHDHLQTLLKEDSAVTALAVNHATSVVYSGSSDGSINFWERRKQLSHGGAIRGHKLAVLCLAVGGALVVSGSADKTICVWRGDAGIHTPLAVLNGHTGPVKCLAMEEDDDCTVLDRRWIVYSGSLDKSVKVWAVWEQSPHHHLLHSQQRMSLTSVSPNFRY